MKKLLGLIILLFGIVISDLNAQTCCTKETTCKKEQCCPTSNDCCTSGNAFFGFFERLFSKEERVETAVVSEEQEEASTSQARAVKEEEVSLTKE